MNINLMKYTISPEQKRFFERNLQIEFEGLFSASQLEILNDGILSTVKLRLKSKFEPSSEQLFMSGHDVWRDKPAIKKIISGTAIGKLLFELTDVKPIRLAYDQFFPSFDNVESSCYSNFLEKSDLISEVSSFQGLLGGLVLCLKSPEKPLKGFPNSVGNSLLFMASCPLPFYELKDSNGIFYLIAFCRDNCVYVLQANDPHSHDLKDIGYNPGDRLNEKNHPTIFR